MTLRTLQIINCILTILLASECVWYFTLINKKFEEIKKLRELAEEIVKENEKRD